MTEASHVWNILDKVSRIVSVSLVGLAGIALVSWVFVIVIFVTARSVFDVKWMFVEEYSGYCMVLLTCFSLAYALRRGAHIRVTAAVEFLSEKNQKILKIFADLIGLTVAIYLTSHGISWFLHGLGGGERSWFPSRTLLWPIYLLIPIGMTALALEFFHQFISALNAFKENRAERK